MNGPAPSRRFEQHRQDLLAALIAVLGVLFSELLPQGETLQVEGLPLLAVLALTGCAGQILAERSLLFDGAALLRACAAFSPSALLAASSHRTGLAPSTDPSPPVLPILSSYFNLYAGLGGWVD